MENNSQVIKEYSIKNLDKIILALVFIAPSLAKSFIIPGFAFSDLFLILIVLLALTIIKVRDLLVVPKWFIYGLLIYSWVVLSGIFSSILSVFFFKRIFKFFYEVQPIFFSAYILFVYLKKLNNIVVFEYLLKIAIFHCIIGFYIWISQTIKTYFGIEIPYNFFWLGQGGPFNWS